MWKHVELREIRVFLMLCEELHFGRTAERLRISQTRVSQTIQELEAKIGTPLFERTSRRVGLTDYGARLREEMAPIYGQLTDVLRRARASSGVIHVRLGLFCDPAVSQILRIVKAFERVFPSSVVDAVEVPVEDPFGPLHRDEFDLMASWLPHGQSGLVVGPMLSREPRVLAVSVDHPLAGRAEISIEDVADYRVLRFATMPDEFHEAWIPSRTPAGRPIRHQRPSDRSSGDRGRMTTELVHLIATGRIVHPTVPSFANMFGNPDIVYVPIADLPPLCSGLVWRQGSEDTRVLDFARVAAEIVEVDLPAAEPTSVARSTWATERPERYAAVMRFVGPNARSRSPEGLAAARAASAELRQVISRCAEAGLIDRGDVDALAVRWRAIGHGLAEFENAGVITDGDASWRSVLTAVIEGYPAAAR